MALLLIMTAAPSLAPATVLADGGSQRFITSAVEHTDATGAITATFPLHRGLSGNQTVYYVITDTSDGNLSSQLGVNESPKLANARGTSAVQIPTVPTNQVDGIHFPATVDFTPARNVVAGNTGFPPAVALPGAVGNPGYSPLVQLQNGTIINAPQIKNDSGQADKITAIDTIRMTVTYTETHGFQGGKPVKYASFDASDPVAAALENATWAPALDAAPTAGDDSGDSSRATLIAFVNGRIGKDNPQRQGLNSAIADGLDPLNVLRWNPSQGRYSPLWDVHLAQWTPSAISSRQNTRQTDYGDILGLVDHGLIRGFGGSAFQANNFIVNCPIVSSN